MKQTTLPIGEDYCTVAYAAEIAQVSMRTVVRAINDGVLAAVRPRVGSRESSRHKRMLLTEQVREWVAARKLLSPEVRGEDGRGCE